MSSKDVAEKLRDKVNNRMDYDTATIHPDYDMTVLNIKNGEYEFEAVIINNTSPQVDEAIVYYPDGSMSNVTDASIDEAVQFITA